MTTIGTSLDTPGQALTIDCHQCLTRYRLHQPNRLRPSAHSTCRTCGARFAVVSLKPASSPGPLDQVTSQCERSLADLHPHATEAAEDATAEKHCSFHGTGSTLLGMQIVNICFSMATLGVYHFWGKAKIRRYLFSQTAFAGDRFVYHGTGKELYQGFLKAMLVFGIPYFLLVAVHTFLALPTWIDMLSQVLGGLVLSLYVPIAMINARRYRLTRTSWRGIRFSFRGRTKDFMTLYIRGWCFTVLTLGTYYPYFQTRRQAFLYSHTYVGNQRFDFTGHGSGLMVPFAVTLFVTYAVLLLCGLTLAFQLTNAGLTLLLIPLVLGPVWIWLLGQKHKYFWDHTTFGSACFSSGITWQKLLSLYLGNIGLLLVTLGFAWPWVTARNARFYTSTLSLRGAANFDNILQDLTVSSVTGEGLSNLLDTGFDMD